MFFHGTTSRLQAGDRLVPYSRSGQSPWAGIYLACPGDAWRGTRVWLFDRPEEAGMWVGGWMAGDGHVYEIAPDEPPVPLLCDPDDEDGLDYGAPPQWHASGGTVIREIPAPRDPQAADERREIGHAPGRIIPVGA